MRRGPKVVVRSSGEGGDSDRVDMPGSYPARVLVKQVLCRFPSSGVKVGGAGREATVKGTVTPSPRTPLADRLDRALAAGDPSGVGDATPLDVADGLRALLTI